MKGILLKDWYGVIHQCRMFLFLVLIFSFISCFHEGDMFFTYYPCVLSGMIAMTLIAYEEREKWEHYAAALPYTRTQLVASKYIVSLCFGAVTVILNLTTQFGYMVYTQNFSSEKLLSMLFVFLPLALVPAAILMPFVFRYGTNKGRIVYYFVIGFFFAAIAGMSANGISLKALMPEINAGLAVFFVTAAVYGISFLLSVRFYKKREL